MANLEELPPEAETPEQPLSKAERLAQQRRENLAKARATRAGNRARQSRAGSSPPSSGPAKSASRQIHDTFTNLAGDGGTALLRVSPIAGAYIGGTTERTAPSARPKTPEERAEYVGNLMERAAGESPLLLKLLMILMHYGIWAELAVFLVDFGLAVGLDQQVIPADSWLGALAFRRLRDVVATLEEEEAHARGSASAIPANGSSRPTRWQPVGASSAG